jgi:hypothetical protein
MKKMENEIWKPINGFNDLYEVSNLGRVRSLDRLDTRGYKIKGVILKLSVANNGYYMVDLRRGELRRNCTVHRLVLETFVGPCSEGMECRHLDGCETNNKVENLAWGTRLENKKGQHCSRKNK